MLQKNLKIKRVCRTKPTNYRHLVNIWSRYNTEQFSALYTGGDNYINFFSHLDTVQKLHFLLKWGIKIQSLKVGNSKVLANQSLPSVCQTVILRENAALQMWILESSSQSCLFDLHPAAPLLSSSEKDNKDDEEDDQDQKYLDHEPAVGGDGLEVFEDLHVSSLHIQLGVLHVSIDPRTEWDSKFNNTIPVYKVKQERLIIKVAIFMLCWMEMVSTAKQFSLCTKMLV